MYGSNGAADPVLAMLAALPATTFLEYYPLPAIVLRVRSLPVLPPHRKPSSTSTAPNGNAHEELAPPPPQAGDESEEQDAVTPLAAPRPSSYSDPSFTYPHTNTYAFTSTPDHDFGFPLITPIASQHMPPVSTPATALAKVVWANEHWERIADGRELHQVIEPHLFAELQKWAECMLPKEANASFQLEIGDRVPITTLELMKTPLPLSDDGTRLVAVTATRHIAPHSHRSGSLRVDKPRARSFVDPISEESAPPNTTPRATPALPPVGAQQLVAPTPHHPQSTPTEASISSASFFPQQPANPPLQERPAVSVNESFAASAVENAQSHLSSATLMSPAMRRRHSRNSATEKLPAQQRQCHILLEERDWSKTKVGPRHKWPEEIETMVKLAFSSTGNDAVWVGEDLQVIYNQSTAVHFPHPQSFGRPIHEIYPDLWSEMRPLARHVLAGNPIHHDNDRLLYAKNDRGHFIEKYHSWSWLPIFDKHNKVLGVYAPSRDTTDQVLAERRLETTRKLVEEVSFARSTKQFFDSIAQVLQENPMDAPFAMCYSVTPKEKTSGSQTLPVAELVLESSVGIPEGGHACAPSKLELPLTLTRASFSSSGTGASTTERMAAWAQSMQAGSGSRGSSSTPSSRSTASSTTRRNMAVGYDRSSWSIARALMTRQCVLVDNCSDMIKGLPIRQWNDLPDQAIVMPLTLGTDDSEIPPAVLIVGLNLYRPLDLEYEDWIQVMRGHLSSALSGVNAFQSEVQQRIEKEKLERAKTSWFRGAAHEFRTPLTLIAGPIDDLLQTTLSTSQRNAMLLAQRNTARLQQLVNSVLDFSRIEAGHLKPKFHPVQLSTFVSELANLFRPALERHKVEFVVEIEPRDQVMAIDPVLVEMALSNILSNALKYTEAGSVTLRLTYDERHANVVIRDTGCGIPADDLALVMDWFHRAHNATGRGAGGAGIGLALAREFIRLHEGEIVISSTTPEVNPNEHGSTFVIRIPTDLHAFDQDVAAAKFGTYGKLMAIEAISWAKDLDSESQLSTESSMQGGTAGSGSFTDVLLFERSDILLIVDDNSEIRSYIKAIFEPFVTVIEASSGEEAVEMAKSRTPHLILCDFMLRKMSGLDVLTNLRAHQVTKLVPIVLLSAANDDELRVSAFVQGAEDFMLKPFKPKELLLRVHLHMQMGKKRARLEMLFGQREQEMAVLYDYCPSGILRMDETGSLTYVNAAFRESAGIAADEAECDSVWREHCDEETWHQIEPVWRAILDGEESTTTFTWKWLNGRTMSGVFIRLDKVRPGLSGIIGCITDISYQEERLHEAERRRVEAEESKHQQELLVDLTSHEIRTPVSAILQCSSLVNENLVALKAQLQAAGPGGFHPTELLLEALEEDIGALESIYQCGLVQERIASDVLSLARIQLDMLTLHDIEMDIRHEASKVLSVFSSEAKMKRINISLQYGQSLSDLGVSGVKTDPVRLGQVITNLISNAIRFTAASDVRDIVVKYEASWYPPAGNPFLPPKSEVRGSVPEDTEVYLFVSVRDTGPGMSKGEREVLFQRFHQGNKMIHTRYGGSGLGLFICKKITELLGGDIEVESDLGKGTEFRFFIKTRTVDPASPPVATPLVHPPTAETPPPTSPLDILRVLIVEDNIINQTVLKRQMLKAGLRCDTADNGLEALQAITRAATQGIPYDVVLMDLEMPVMDGLTAVRKMRAAEPASAGLRSQLVIALTGNARQGQIDQALEAGMDDVVIKPYRLKELLERMRSWVAQKRARRASDPGLLLDEGRARPPMLSADSRRASAL